MEPHLSPHFKGLMHRIRRCAHVIAALGAALSMAGNAAAVNGAGPNPAGGAVTVKLTVWKVKTDAKGNETFGDATRVLPGDVLEYRALYTNVSKQPVKNVFATLPLPEGFEYLPRSAQPEAPKVEVAAKDGKFGAEPLKQAVADRTGKSQVESVPYAEYRSVRWTLPLLAAGKSEQVKARVRVGTGGADIEPHAAQAPPGIKQER